MAISRFDYEYEQQRLMKEEWMYRRMMDMQNQVEVTKPSEPEKPKKPRHLNQKLLLVKG